MVLIRLLTGLMYTVQQPPRFSLLIHKPYVLPISENDPHQDLNANYFSRLYQWIIRSKNYYNLNVKIIKFYCLLMSRDHTLIFFSSSSSSSCFLPFSFDLNLRRQMYRATGPMCRRCNTTLTPWDISVCLKTTAEWDHTGHYVIRHPRNLPNLALVWCGNLKDVVTVFQLNTLISKFCNVHETKRNW